MIVLFIFLLMLTAAQPFIWYAIFIVLQQWHKYGLFDLACCSSCISFMAVFAFLVFIVAHKTKIKIKP